MVFNRAEYRKNNKEKIRAYDRKYKETHKEEIKKYRQDNKARFKISSKLFFINQRKKLLEIYGDKCACCGEDNPLFLTLDHINNDGAKHKKRVGRNNIWRDVIKHPDKTKYQTLCFNCNCGRQRNDGICPHKTKEVVS